MKKLCKSFALIVVALSLLAVPIFGAQVTQTASAVSKNLPITNDQFKDQINNAMYDLTQTDVPALIVSANLLDGGTLAPAGGTVAITGELTVSKDIAVNGGDITCPADLTITPTGDDVLVDGGLNVGGTDQAGDNNLRVIGTAIVDGSLTATGTIAAVNAATVGTTLTVNSRYPLLSKATTQESFERGVSTNNETIAYGTVFGAAPQIFLTYQESPGDTTEAYVSAITTTNFAVSGTAAKNVGWLAIGNK